MQYICTRATACCRCWARASEYIDDKGKGRVICTYNTVLLSTDIAAMINACTIFLCHDSVHVFGILTTSIRPRRQKKNWNHIPIRINAPLPKLKFIKSTGIISRTSVASVGGAVKSTRNL